MGKKQNILDTVSIELGQRDYGPSGKKMPPVREICARFDVGTSTAVNAMIELSEKGYVDRRQGIGYFVGPVVPSQTIDKADLRTRIAQMRQNLDMFEEMLLVV